jgi:hypothetical protein
MLVAGACQQQALHAGLCPGGVQPHAGYCVQTQRVTCVCFVLDCGMFMQHADLCAACHISCQHCEKLWLTSRLGMLTPPRPLNCLMSEGHMCFQVAGMCPASGLSFLSFAAACPCCDTSCVVTSLNVQDACDWEGVLHILQHRTADIMTACNRAHSSSNMGSGQDLLCAV